MIANGSKRSNYANSNYPLVSESFIIGSLLGIGAYSKVYLAHEIQTGRKFAIKIINSVYHNTSKSKNKYLKRELEALDKFYTDCIIKYYSSETYLIESDTGSVEPHDCIILEYAENGSLFDYISSEKKCFNEKISRALFLQIVNTLEKCHYEGIAHGDLKTENILFLNLVSSITLLILKSLAFILFSKFSFTFFATSLNMVTHKGFS